MADNFHATGVVLGDRGVLVAGASGSGKTQLALALILHARSFGLFARLVADDQLFLAAHNGRLVCAAPEAIAGLAEFRGLGPRPVEHEPRAVVDLLVRLVEPDQAPRFPEHFPEEDTELLAGCAIPRLALAARSGQGAVLAVASRLSLPPFAPFAP